jgi:D-cysteine desulfhydrase
MAGLIDLVRNGTFRRGERILFWHTGGSPGLFAYESLLSPAVHSMRARSA